MLSSSASSNCLMPLHTLLKMDHDLRRLMYIPWIKCIDFLLGSPGRGEHKGTAVCHRAAPACPSTVLWGTAQPPPAQHSSNTDVPCRVGVPGQAEPPVLGMHTGLLQRDPECPWPQPCCLCWHCQLCWSHPAPGACAGPAQPQAGLGGALCPCRAAWGWAGGTGGCAQPRLIGVLQTSPHKKP